MVEMTSVSATERLHVDSRYHSRLPAEWKGSSQLWESAPEGVKTCGVYLVCANKIRPLGSQ